MTATETPNRLMLWVCVAFGVLIAAWAAFFIIASHHHVESVPLEAVPTQRK